MSILDLSKKRALVIGGGQGMGRSTALHMAEAGADVAVVDSEGERADRVAAEIGGLGRRGAALVADVTDEADAQRVVGEASERFGGLDIVVNIVGSASWATLLEVDEETWERDFSVNLKHHLYVSRAAARAWVEAGEAGVLCVVGSVSGLFSAANHAAYGAAKAGLLAFVRSAAEEWWPHGVRINAVVPGTVRTPRIEAAWADGSIAKPAPDTLDRMATPDDIAGAITFLSSNLARCITGQTLIVDGGATTKFPFAMG